jgi:hypothetical protein
MHIIIGLLILLAGFGWGNNISWLLGLPVVCLGLYVMFGIGGKKGARWRQDQENLFFLLGLLSIPVLILIEIF